MRNRFPVTALTAGVSVLAVLALASLAPGTSPAIAAGAVASLVEGTVKVAGPAPMPSPVKIAKDTASCGAEYIGESVCVGKDGELANVVVSLRPTKTAGGTPVPAPSHAVLDQERCRYKPHVQAVGVGSELTLLNSDRVLHNVHGNIGPVTVFNFAMPIKGQKLPTKLTRPGLVRLQCDAGHTWMNAWVYVFDHPYYAVTDEHGHFAIHDVPPGEYALEYWHEPLDGKGPGVVKTTRLVVGPKTIRADGLLKL